jgi:hypothetical protein
MLSTPRGLILLLLVGLASQAMADPQSKSWSSWSVVPGGMETNYTIASRELKPLAINRRPDQSPAQLLAAELALNLQLDTGLGPCRLQPATSLAANPGFVRLRLRWLCPADASSATLSNTAMLRLAPSHIHFARFNLPGQAPFERLFSRHNNQYQLGLRVLDNDPPARNLHQLTMTYVGFGVEHILMGLDHIAFLLGLLLLSRRLVDVILVVTGFTLGHSITLGLTALGVLTPQQSMVEGLIGFTIAMVAIENVMLGAARQHQAAVIMALALLGLALLGALSASGPAPLSLVGMSLFSYCYLKLGEEPSMARKLRPGLTVVFGLVHGFGFAGVLLEVGLPAGDLIPALFGFNLGVELGQLLIVTALALLTLTLRWWHNTYASKLQLAANLGLCALGSFWFIQRLYFPG